jgi:outer membrane protein assembly factor BamB
MLSQSNTEGNTSNSPTSSRRYRWVGLLVPLGLAIAGFTLIMPYLSGGRMRHPGAPVRPDTQSAEQSISTQANSPQATAPRAGSSVEAILDVASPADAGSRNAENTTSELISTTTNHAATDWSRFRGPNGTGFCSDTSIPTEWSESKNLKWSIPLPGPGSSSPILTDQYVFLTCYTGINGEGQRETGKLKRHLLCIQREDGKIVWTHEESAIQPEDPYQGMGVPEHGYATNTPVTDGNRVYAFFGKSGVLAFDMQGKKLWQTSVGTESGNRAWGTASSLILYEDLVIVNASEESQSIRALNAETGEEVWNAVGSALELAYGTPILAKVDDQRTDLVIAVPGEIWGLNPRTGKLVWYAETTLTGNLSPSLILDGDTVIAFGGYRSSGSLAIRIGGTGDVTKSHVVWTSRNSSYVSTPVLVDGKLYWIDDRGTYYASSAKDGELIHRSRVSNITSRDRPVYASAVALGNRLYFQTRFDGLLVAEPGTDLKIISQNRFEGDKSMCNATPATDRGELYLRSDSHLYCVRAER